MAIDLKRPLRKIKEALGRLTGRPSSELDDNWVVTGRNVTMPSGLPTHPGADIEYLNPDEVVRRKGWDVYEEMRQDDQIKAALAMKTTLVAARQWVVKPASDSAVDKEAADFVQQQLEQVDLNEIMRQVCSAFTWGCAVGEIVWQNQKWKGRPVIGLENIPFRHPRNITFRADKHGRLVEIEQETDMMIGTAEHFIVLPARRVFHWAYREQFGNPYGDSDLRSVYKNWFAKKYIINFWNVLLERLGSPLMVIRYPQGTNDGLKATLKRILRTAQAKTELLIPEGVKMELLEATRAGNGGYKEALDYHDNSIARGALMPALLGMSEALTRGSDSQARIHVRTLFKMTAELGDSIIKQVQKQVIRPMVDFNFEVTEYPEVELGDYGEFEVEILTDAIRLQHAAGILELDGDDTNKIRSLLNLPIRDTADVDTVVRPPEPPPPGNANAPPPAAAQGNNSGGGKQNRTGSGGSTGAKGGQGGS